MTRLPLDAATVLQALSLELEHEPVDADQVVSGAPTTGIAALAELDDIEIGVAPAGQVWSPEHGHWH